MRQATETAKGRPRAARTADLTRIHQTGQPDALQVLTPLYGTTAARWLTELLDHVGSQPIGARLRQCPGHRDASPSLSVSAGRDGAALLRCHAGCDVGTVLAALRCAPVRLFRPPPMPAARYATVAGVAVDFPPVILRHGHPAARGYRLAGVHRYAGGQREWLLERWRCGPHKELRWHTVRDGHAVPGLFGTPVAELPLYREREALMAVAAGEPVFLVESESSVDALHGWFATTWAGGAAAVNVGRLRQVLSGYGRTVVIPDNDEPGMRCLQRLTDAGLAPHVLIGEPGEDARDLYARLGRDAFAAAVREVLAGGA